MTPKTVDRRKLASKRTTADQALSGLDVKGRVAVVTGGSSGIGVETCRALARAGAKVYVGARSKAAADSVIEDIKQDGGPDVHLLLLDLANLESVRAAAERLLVAEPGGIHMLILNAGVMACPLTRTQDGLEIQTGVNHVAHFYLTQLLLPALQTHGTPSRIVSVASSAHSMGGLDMDDLNWEKRHAAGKYGPWLGYGQSKVCNVLFARELASRLVGTPVLVFSLHPGIIMTALQRHQSWFVKGAIRVLTSPWAKNPKQGAATNVFAATAPELEGHSGAYLSNCRVTTSSALGADPAAAAALWVATEALLERALKGELRWLVAGKAGEGGKAGEVGEVAVEAGLGMKAADTVVGMKATKAAATE